MEGTQKNTTVEVEEVNTETTNTEPQYQFEMVGDDVLEEVKVEENEIIENQEQPKEVEVKEEVKNDDSEYVELDEEIAYSFIAKQKGMTVEDFKNSLTTKEEKKYAPEMVAFNEFVEKTGNKNYNDFLETQKDWSEESPENTLKEFIRLSNPDLSRKEQEFLYNEKYSTEDLDEEDDENLILKKGIDAKTDLRKATEFFSKRKEEFNVVSGTDEHIPLEYREAKKLIDSQNKEQEDYVASQKIVRDEFLAKTNARFTDNFEGFKIKLGNETDGFEVVSFKPDNIKEVREFVSDSDNLMRDFLDEKGNLKQEDFQDALYFAKHKDKLMNQAFNRGIAHKLEADDKKSKNIQIDNQQASQTEANGGYQFFAS